PRGAVRGAGFFTAHPGAPDAREQGVEARVVPAFQPERREVVGLAFGDDDPLARLVQAVSGAAVAVRRLARQAEHRFAEALPLERTAHFQHEVAELHGGRRHGFLRVRLHEGSPVEWWCRTKMDKASIYGFEIKIGVGVKFCSADGARPAA